MATAERITPEAGVHGASGVAEPGMLGTYEAFGRRRISVNTWRTQDRYFSLLLAPPHSEIREDGAIVLSSDEVSMEKVSLTPGTAVIELTDEEAEKIVESFGNDAFSSQ